MAILICDTNSITLSEVIFLDFSKKNIEIPAIRARIIDENILSTENINQRMIQRKLAFAIVCPICTSRLTTIKFHKIDAEIAIKNPASKAF